MGAAIGHQLLKQGKEVAWASHGRSTETCARAEEAGLTDLAKVKALSASCEIVLSICPPHAAVETAEAFQGYDGIYADLNAVSTATAHLAGEFVERYVDGGIVGPPPRT